MNVKHFTAVELNIYFKYWTNRGFVNTFQQYIILFIVDQKKIKLAALNCFIFLINE